ncbi:hypothetical protein [Bradyrhizobium sp. CCBAU 11357]|uniref:hypothetical protein n=1 Tax=Bradyrhizobium sp. CCBAU 11357 TaxID=1630808 RepID=UPI0023046538|nr:hypothetical protein [Bradyrhizobium sp. CCBAU 11357]
MVNELLQDDWDPEKIVRQKDELKVKLLCAQSVVAECKAGLADLERRLERRAISLRIDERHLRQTIQYVTRYRANREASMILLTRKLPWRFPGDHETVESCRNPR